LSLDGQRTLTAHNGFLTTIVECGVPLAMVLFVLLGLSLARLMRTRALDINARHVLLSLCLYCLQRALSENYLVLNVGNTVTVLFLLVNTLALTNPIFGRAIAKQSPIELASSAEFLQPETP
jgi:hypothetical protein